MELKIGGLTGTMEVAGKFTDERAERLFNKNTDIVTNTWRCHEAIKPDPNPPVTRGKAKTLFFVHARGYMPPPPTPLRPDMHKAAYDFARRLHGNRFLNDAGLNGTDQLGRILGGYFGSYSYTIPHEALLARPYAQDHAMLYTSPRYHVFEFKYQGKPANAQIFIALPYELGHSIFHYARCTNAGLVPIPTGDMFRNVEEVELPPRTPKGREARIEVKRDRIRILEGEIDERERERDRLLAEIEELGGQ